jgi:hypothetical protein
VETATVVRDAVMFVAANLSPLAPADFITCVSALLDVEPAGSGTAEWLRHPDRVLALCGVAVLGESGMVGFADPGDLARAREALARDAPLRVHVFTRALEEPRLMFGASDRLADAVARHFSRLVTARPRHFGSAWLSSVFARAQGSPSVPPAQAIARFVSLLARYFAHPALAAEADAVLAALVLDGRFDDALALVRGLLHTTGFASYDWLRRLANAGHAPAHAAIREIIRAEFQGARLDALLTALAGWLPPSHGDGSACRPSCGLAFTTALQFAVAAADTWGADEIADGEPGPDRSAQPLAERMVALARLLFHPALPRVVAGTHPDDLRDARRLLARWVARCVFVLGGRGVQGPMVSSGETPLEMLLNEIDRLTSDPPSHATRVAMVACWEEMRQALAGPRDLTRERKMLTALVKRFSLRPGPLRVARRRPRS